MEGKKSGAEGATQQKLTFGALSEALLVFCAFIGYKRSSFIDDIITSFFLAM